MNEHSILFCPELRLTSIEKCFPKITKLYAMILPGFWIDIGQRKDYKPLDYTFSTRHQLLFQLLRIRQNPNPEPKNIKPNRKPHSLL